MDVQILTSLADVSAEDWNQLREGGFPFSRHEHLMALETTNCLGERTGWHPNYVLLHDQLGALVGATWFYEKTNSYGEFVFDYEWAELYDRLGMSYYPKGVQAIPFTPATGPKLLVHKGAIFRKHHAHSEGNEEIWDHEKIQRELVRVLHQRALRLGLSQQSALFLPPNEQSLFKEEGFSLRSGIQFQWFNPGCSDFDDYLDLLKKKKRKEVRYERKNLDDDLKFRTLTGCDLTPEWADFAYRLYCKTHVEKMSYVCLTRSYFEEIFSILQENIVFFVAFANAKSSHPIPIGGALYFQEDRRMFGRYWGALQNRKFLHFELCYYQPLEYAISKRLACIEAGAQGSHKLSRGFLPCYTVSAHLFFQSSVQDAFFRYCAQEREQIAQNLEIYKTHLPYQHDNRIRNAGEETS